VVAAGTAAVAALGLVPAGVAQAPHEAPGWKAIGSVVFLGLVGTALAYVIWFTLIASAGASYAALVTYLVPPLALAYGALFLDERFGAAAFGGLALILGGVALGTGALRPAWVRRRLAAQRDASG
jgi:drug/metabolite transporter (DMT)-like permease